MWRTARRSSPTDSGSFAPGVIQLDDIWNFEGLGFDLTAFRMADGVHGEIAYGTTANFLSLHGGPHEVLVDKSDLLTGVTFPLL